MRMRLRGTRRHGGDAGITLVMVLGLMAVLSVFLLTSLAYVLNSAPPSRRDQDSKAALAAAEAGMEDYISRLNANSNYWSAGNTDATNAAFSAAGASIPGTGGTGARFTYQLVSPATDIARYGVLRLQVTGSSGPDTARAQKATILATLKPKKFLQYVYLSDVEVIDPALPLNTPPISVRLNGSSGYSDQTGDGVEQGCSQYYYGGRSSPSFTASVTTPVVRNSDGATITSGTVTGFTCFEITWTSGDVLQGPFHSNDAIQVTGNPLFTDPQTESSWSSPPSATHRWWGSGTPSSGTTGQPGYQPVYADPLPLPVSNSTLKQYVEPRADDPTHPGPGCLYTGATRIIFQGTSMKVLSPGTTSAPARCLDTTHAGTEQVISPIPPVIYVDATSGSCTTGAIGYPATGEYTGGVTTDYDCHRGTAYVSGTVTGQVTVAGLDDIVVTNDLLTTNGTSGTDVVGLIAGNYVWVYHPVKSSNTSQMLIANWPNYIDAAILGLRHSFLVQNWNLGPCLSTSTDVTSKLNILGALAQKFRGPVGTSGGGGGCTGYLKNYVYDTRLATLQPPYFLQPSTSPWSAVSVTDR
jgi:hypothetical protein